MFLISTTCSFDNFFSVLKNSPLNFLSSIPQNNCQYFQVIELNKYKSGNLNSNIYGKDLLLNQILSFCLSKYTISKFPIFFKILDHMFLKSFWVIPILSKSEIRGPQ